MKTENISNGLRILAKYGFDTCELVPVPATFPNGAPAASHSAYLSVEANLLVNIDEDDMKGLAALGWKKECDGEFYTIQ